MGIKSIIHEEIIWGENMKLNFILLSILLYISLLVSGTTPPTVKRDGQSSAEFIPIMVGGITTFIPAPVKNATPTVVAKQFVRAYLNHNDVVMKTITYNNSIKRLKEIDSKVRGAFQNIFSYDEQVYFHGYKAVVIVKTKVPETVMLKFYFSWVSNRWVLDRVT